MNHYLIDLENVGSSCLKAMAGLSNTAHVHLFCTEKSSKLPPDVLVTLNAVRHTFHAAPVGPQSLDKHLLSVLGFLIGREGNGSNYVIVSKDKGYDPVIAYWRTTQRAHVSRVEALAESVGHEKVSTRPGAPSKKPEAPAKNVSNGPSKKADAQKREHQIRCYFGVHFKELKYQAKKENIIQAVLAAKTKAQLNAELQKSFRNDEVKVIYSRLKPFIEGLPGQ